MQQYRCLKANTLFAGHEVYIFCTCLVYVPKETQNICMTFIQRWTNVEDVGPALDKCYTNVLCFLGLLKTT